jgi:DNA-binding phage protein
MKRNHLLVAGAVAVLVAVVAGAGIAATKALTPKQESQAIINDAAQQLGVQPSELSNALEQALKNRVDAAVKDGLLTKEQGARLKKRVGAGDFPLFRLGPGPGFRDRHGPGIFHAKLEAAADYLGMTEANLREALENGKTLAQVARDRGKSVEGVVNALLAGAEAKLDAAVRAGRLTEAEKADMLSGLRQRITALVNGRFPSPAFGPGLLFRGHGHGLFHAGLEVAANYVGMSEAHLREALESGKTLAQVARDRGKSVDGLVSALLARVEQKIDAAGKLTEAEKRKMVAAIRDRINDLVNGRFSPRFGPKFRHSDFRGDRPAIF